jgi:hypothetical protein
MKLASIYKQVKEENEGPVKVLVPRRSPEEREKNFLIATNKKIQEYIKNGNKGDLDLESAPITSLPDNLTKVGGYLYLENTKITSLPKNLTVEGYLALENTPITSLPKNLTVGGYLSLSYTSITSLPKNLTVGGYLSLSYTSITSLPDDLTVEGDLFLQRTPISKQYTGEQIKQMVPGIKGDIYF